MIKTILIIASSFLLAACANGYGQFYTSILNPDGKPPAHDAFTGDPQVVVSNDLKKDGEALVRKGYVPLGYSSFNGPTESIADAKAQAKAVGAAIVLVSSKYTNTESGAVPITSPTTTTTSTTVTGTSQGAIGSTPYYGNYSGFANSTTYGTQTTYVPYSVDRYDQSAVYFAKGKPRVFGAIFAEAPPPALTKQAGTNKGVYVSYVVQNTPAFYADVLEGDLILSVNGSDVYSPQQLLDLFKSLAGQRVTVVLFRHGKTLRGDITLASPTENAPPAK